MRLLLWLPWHRLVAMTIIIPVYALLGGACSAMLYIAVAHGWLVGVTAPLLPLFALALSGMTYGRPGVMAACIAASLLVIFSLPLQDALLLVFMQIIPLGLLLRALMRATLRDGERRLHFASMGDGVWVAALYGAVFFALIVGSNSALYSYISERMLTEVAAGFAAVDAQTGADAEAVIKAVPHLVLAASYWLWMLTAVLVSLLAYAVAETLGVRRRPPLRLGTHSPPDALLAALGIAGMTSFSGVESLIQAGQAAGLVLLLPYCFSGLGAVHAALRRLQGGRLWLALFYAVVCITGWLLLIVTLFGLVRHLGRYTLFSSPRT